MDRGVMLRRSNRLQNAGYYKENGTPSVCYKENSYKIFQKRVGSSIRAPRFSTIYCDPIPQLVPIDDSQDHNSRITIKKYQETNTRITRNKCYDLTPSQTRVTLLHKSSPLTFSAQAIASRSNQTLITKVNTIGTQTLTVDTQVKHILTTEPRQTLIKPSVPPTPFRNQRSQTTLSGLICCLLAPFKHCVCSADTKRNIIYSFLLLLFLALGVTHHHIERREFQQEVQSLRQSMNMLVPLADTIPNFALESQGARVLNDLSSDTHWPTEHPVNIWKRLSYWWYSYRTQQRVIKGHSLLHPGQCWPFSGNRGHLFVSLSHPVSITHVTLGHITKSQSVNGHITSAPRRFSIYGMTTTEDEGTYFGTMFYNQDGEAHQTFKLPYPDKGFVRHVKLQIENNWGNTENTCIYSFRVHGKLPA